MQSVIGVFDTQEDAESARESLIRAGFDEDDVRVQSHRSVRADTEDRSEDEDEGFMAKVGHFFSDLFGGSDDDKYAGHYAEHVRRGGSVVVVDVEDEDRVDAARSALATAGAVDIDRRTEAWREEGYSGFDAEARPYRTEEVQAERSRSDRVLPVVEEELEVGKRRVDLGAVRVVSRVETRPVQEQVELREERADIQRRPVNRPATEADLRAGDNGAIELEESTERPVVSKTARVVEEVSVGQRSSSRTETVSDELRKTVVDVEKTGNKERGRMSDAGMSGSAEADMGVGMSGSSYSTTGSGSDTMSAARTFSGDDNSQSAMSWQERNANSPAYSDRMSTSGGSMSADDEMAYRYGSTLRSDQRYAGRSSWDEVEADARADWSERNPNSNWERAKAAVRNGWESMTGRR